MHTILSLVIWRFRRSRPTWTHLFLIICLICNNKLGSMVNRRLLEICANTRSRSNFHFFCWWGWLICWFCWCSLWDKFWLRQSGLSYNLRFLCLKVFQTFVFWEMSWIYQCLFKSLIISFCHVNHLFDSGVACSIDVDMVIT